MTYPKALTAAERSAKAKKSSRASLAAHAIAAHGNGGHDQNRPDDASRAEDATETHAAAAAAATAAAAARSPETRLTIASTRPRRSAAQNVDYTGWNIIGDGGSDGREAAVTHHHHGSGIPHRISEPKVKAKPPSSYPMLPGGGGEGGKEDGRAEKTRGGKRNGRANKTGRRRRRRGKEGGEGEGKKRKWIEIGGLTESYGGSFTGQIWAGMVNGGVLFPSGFWAAEGREEDVDEGGEMREGKKNKADGDGSGGGGRADGAVEGNGGEGEAMDVDVDVDVGAMPDRLVQKSVGPHMAVRKKTHGTIWGF